MTLSPPVTLTNNWLYLGDAALSLSINATASQRLLLTRQFCELRSWASHMCLTAATITTSYAQYVMLNQVCALHLHKVPTWIFPIWDVNLRGRSIKWSILQVTVGVDRCSCKQDPCERWVWPHSVLPVTDDFPNNTLPQPCSPTLPQPFSPTLPQPSSPPPSHSHALSTLPQPFSPTLRQPCSLHPHSHALSTLTVMLSPPSQPCSLHPHSHALPTLTVMLSPPSQPCSPHPPTVMLSPPLPFWWPLIK